MITKRHLRAQVADLTAQRDQLREQRDEARGQAAAEHTALRTACRQLEDVRARLAKSQQGRRNLMGLLEHHRDAGPLGMRRQHRDRLARALRACARYRAELAEQERAHWRVVAVLSRRMLAAEQRAAAQLATHTPEVTR